MIGFLTIAAVVISATAVPSNALTPRIVGGVIVSNIEDVPYQVSVQLNGKHYCGGIIISENYVLTAAACVPSGVTSQYTIRSGSIAHNFNGVVHSVNRIIKHQNYYINNYNIPVNDIALIQVITPMIFDGTRDALPLISKQPVRVGSVAKISGWGWKNNTFPIQLQKTSVNIYDTRACNVTYQGRVPPGQICAFARGRDACNADAGGPLVVGVHLAGIISWGRGCGLAAYPGVYTDILSYRNWISFYSGV